MKGGVDLLDFVFLIAEQDWPLALIHQKVGLWVYSQRCQDFFPGRVEICVICHSCGVIDRVVDEIWAAGKHDCAPVVNRVLKCARGGDCGIEPKDYIGF